MEFTFETEYNATTMASMAKALRKTMRKKHNRRSHVFGWIAAILGLLLTISKGFALDFRTIITLTAVLVIVLAIFFEDKLNGYIAKKQLLPGTEKVTTVFSPDGFISTTDIGKSEWKYDKIQLLVETTNTFVFIFSASHAQIYDKKHLQGGAVDDFRCFIEEATKKQVQYIK